MWVKVLDNQIVESALLPEGRINATPDADLSDINWYFWESTTPPEYDQLVEKPVDVTLLETAFILDNKVQQKWQIIALSPEEKYSPDNFLLGLNQNPAYQTWSNQLPPNPYSNFLLAVQRASESRNWVHVQAYYNGFKQAIAPPTEAVVEWQNIADNYGIPIVF